eukprot:Sspe_Gene.23970::Locus_9394_Transcript_1_1_Confidence_1.000_Length_653::g.23970::m.23970
MDEEKEKEERGGWWWWWGMKEIFCCVYSFVGGGRVGWSGWGANRKRGIGGGGGEFPLSPTNPRGAGKGSRRGRILFSGTGTGKGRVKREDISERNKQEDSEKNSRAQAHSGRMYGQGTALI